MNLKDIEKIIERDLPGHRRSRKSMVSEDESIDLTNIVENEKPEAETPDFQTLREKYLSEKFFGSTESNSADNSAEFLQSKMKNRVETPIESEDVIVAVRPTQSTNFQDDSSQIKTAVISAKEKKVIGQQG
jgi:hypothetical protein